MYRDKLIRLFILSAALTSVSQASVALAQSSETSLTSLPSKASLKAQRKVDRKAARAKKNAELKLLQQNGYQTQSDQINYPQNIQNAERKAAVDKAASSK